MLNKYLLIILLLPLLLFTASENKESIIGTTEGRSLPIEPINPKTLGVMFDASNEFVVQPVSYKFLLLGDSFMAKNGGVGEPLESQLLTFQGVSVNRLGVVSSGLIDTNFFDWYKESKKLFEKNKPDFVIILLGNNDVKPIKVKTSEGEVVDFLYFGTEEWNGAYQKKVSDFLKIFEKEGVRVYWIGLSMMRDETFNAQMKILNNIYQDEIKNHKNVNFIPTWNLLSDDQDNYAQYLPDEEGRLREARLADGIHLTQFSGSLITSELIKNLAIK